MSSRHRQIIGRRTLSATGLLAAAAASAVTFASPAVAAPVSDAPHTGQSDKPVGDTANQSGQDSKDQGQAGVTDQQQGQDAHTQPGTTDQSGTADRPGTTGDDQAGVTTATPQAAPQPGQVTQRPINQPPTLAAPVAPLPVPGNPTGQTPAQPQTAPAGQPGAAKPGTGAQRTQNTQPGARDGKPGAQSSPDATTAPAAQGNTAQAQQGTTGNDETTSYQGGGEVEAAPVEAAPAPVAPVVKMVPPHAEMQVNIDGTRAALPARVSANTRAYVDNIGGVATAGYSAGAVRGTTGIAVEHTSPTAVHLTAFVGDESAAGTHTAATDVDYTAAAAALNSASTNVDNFISAQPGGAQALANAKQAGADANTAVGRQVAAATSGSKPLNAELAGVQLHAASDVKR